MERVYLWDQAPGMCEEVPFIDIYIPENKKSDAAVLVFQGGGYIRRADHERENYAKFLNAHGITAFIGGYRVSPHRFPLPLLDARRCMRYIRANAEKFVHRGNAGFGKGRIALDSQIQTDQFLVGKRRNGTVVRAPLLDH